MKMVVVAAEAAEARTINRRQLQRKTRRRIAGREKARRIMPPWKRPWSLDDRRCYHYVCPNGICSF